MHAITRTAASAAMEPRHPTGRSSLVASILRRATGNRSAGDGDLAVTIRQFQPISLKQLNAKAEMLARRDNKYVVRGAQLGPALAALRDEFDVLEIAAKRDFTYETCYFDDAGFTSYHEQIADTPQRSKIRTRHYTDAGLCYVEFKLKGDNDITIKERLPYPVDHYGRLDDNAWAHIRSAYRNLCGRPFERDLEPVVEMRYQRITLVARQGGERTTIDHALTFASRSGTRQLASDLFIMETKSDNADGIADRILRGLGVAAADSCSKYCLALAMLGEVEGYDKFVPTLRALDAMP